jgi:hypothetical protein
VFAAGLGHDKEKNIYNISILGLVSQEKYFDRNDVRNNKA